MLKGVLNKLWVNIFTIFSGRNLLWQLFAFALTYFVVVSGFDWKYFVAFNNTAVQTFLFPAVIIGALLPILLPIVLYLVGRYKRLMLHNAAYAVVQAGALGLVISDVYKIFTGRIQPPLDSASLVDMSNGFQFGFLRHGIFWGWPSSHTTVAFAVAVTLFILYRKNWVVRVLAFAVALYIGIGVSMSVHWFSDFLAGAIIGSVIGAVVGGAFSSTRKSS